jgi:hypothetical protein
MTALKEAMDMMQKSVSMIYKDALRENVIIFS